MKKWIFIWFIFSSKLYATHIVGGELNYQYLNSNKYKITLKLYIDCYNGQAGAIAQDEYANIAVFSNNNDSLMAGLSFSIKRSLPIRVSKTNYNCIKISPNACVDAYYYDTVVSLPYRSGGYTLSFQRCCRNNTILNLVNPQSTGENLWTKIADTLGFGFNNSAVFKNLPPNFLCTNAPLIFDHSAIDSDGDSLVYEFFHPYTGATSSDPRPPVTSYELPPFSKVVFTGGYTFGNAINSLPAVSVDKKTGLLKITPTLSGQFVVGIVVKEYRKGKLIGFTQRDYQFNVQDCVFETTSAFVTPDINCDREVRFNNTSQNATKYFWDFGDSLATNDTANTKSGYYKYPKAGTYNVKLIASNGNCADTLFKIIEILDNIKFKLPNDTLLCNKQTIKIAPDKFYRNAVYKWSDNSSDSTLLVTNEGQYWVSITYGKCLKSDTFILTYDKERVTLEADLNCNKNSKQIEGFAKVKGQYNTIDWYSMPKQIANNTKDSIVSISQAGFISISGLKQNNCPYADSIKLEPPDKYKIFKLPNVFTPNNDGINDYYPELLPPYFYHLIVYDRWGLKVFESDNTAWDSGNMPAGVYYYFIEANACGLDNKTHGVIHVIK